MKPSHLIDELSVCYEADIVAYIEGPPGVGKSDIVWQLADLLRCKLFDVRAALYEPTVLQGMPALMNRKTGLPILGHPKYDEPPDIYTTFASFDFWPHDENAIIFFDEFVSATPAQQAMYYQILWGRRLGTQVFPASQRFILAGNRLIDKAYVNRMSTANKSRVVTMTFDVDFGDWHTWAINKPIDARVIFYQKWRHYEYLHRFDPAKDDGSFPCPRTWEMVSRDLIAADKRFAGRVRPSRFEKIKGMVGEAAAADFCGFLDIMDKMINPDLVLLKPREVDLPTDPSVIMALCSAIANKATKANMPQVCQFADRLPNEYSALLMWTAGKRDRSLWATTAGQEWAQNHPEILAT